MTEPAVCHRPVEPFDRRLLLLSEQDNVVVACANLQEGEMVRMDGDEVTLPANAPVGFKIARRDLAPGDRVLSARLQP